MGQRRILIVDDEHYIVDLLAELLEEEGYDVVRAYDGLSALTRVTEDRPELVLADVMMPRLDGLGLVSQLRQMANPPAIVLMSAAVIPRDPAIPFIPKPFDIEHILKVIETSLLEKHSTNGRAESSRPDSRSSRK